MVLGFLSYSLERDVKSTHDSSQGEAVASAAPLPVGVGDDAIRSSHVKSERAAELCSVANSPCFEIEV